jgi:hypothetical protein
MDNFHKTIWLFVDISSFFSTKKGEEEGYFAFFQHSSSIFC